MRGHSSTIADEPGVTGRFEPFDLMVHLGLDAIPWVSATSRAGSVHGIPRRSEVLPPLADLLDLVYDYTDAVQFTEPQPDPELAGILWDLVFGDPMVRQLFQAARGVGADRGRQLLIRILTSPHLATLPWELLPEPDAASSGPGHRYLALAPDTHLVRLARGRSYPVRTALLEAPLNLLIVLSSPNPRDEDEEDWLSFDIFEVKRGLLEELEPLERAGLLRIDVEDHPTLENLRRRIGAQRRGYHLFHYVGHALPDTLILEDRTGRREDLASAPFMEVLRLCPDLRLAVFAGCETARAAGDPASFDARTAVGWRDLLSLADYCVQEACPAVIGMQAVLPFGTERTFTRFFYQALASGYSTAEALRLARGAIRGDRRLGEDVLDWSVPVLFVGSSEPGAMVPRSAAVPSRPSRRVRSELMLGLRQSNERFLARDLPLRQAVEIMAAADQAKERVLLITGAKGVGKTSLVERALEELPASVTHMLYVPLDRLAPEVVRACQRMDAGQGPDLDELSRLHDNDDALMRLCRLTSERLRDGGSRPRPRDRDWKAVDWWERLVGDIIQHRFVLVIEDIGLLDHLARGLLERFIGQPELLEGLIERCPGRRAGDDPAGPSRDRLLEDLEDLLDQAQEDRGTGERPREPRRIPLESLRQELRRELDGIPDELHAEGHRVLDDYLERRVVSLGQEQAQRSSGVETPGGVPPPGAIDRDSLIGALKSVHAVRRSLGSALRALAERRSPARIVITGADAMRDLFGLPEEHVFELRLARLTWPETWRWIRRNLPALVRYGEVYLYRLWSRLGTNLDRWEDLERRVLTARGPEVDLPKLAGEILSSTPARSPGVGPAAALARRGERALRIAVAGPFLAGPDEMAEAITRVANECGIGGRVVPDADKEGALAVLIDEPSPFGVEMTASDAMMLEWLDRAIAKQPDILLLDYRALIDPSEIDRASELDAQYILLRRVHRRSLLIAAGGNREGDSFQASRPAVYPEVLSVGPLGDDGRLRDYAQWHPGLVKPDLFMADNLAPSPLATAFKPEVVSRHERASSWGSTFSAFHAVAASVLVWSILPELSPRGVRDLLIQASGLIDGTEGARRLAMVDAVALAREWVVQRRLEAGPVSLATLGDLTGLEKRVLSATLELLMKDGRVVKLASGRLERYQWVEPPDRPRDRASHPRRSSR
jgi:hypothetical protein